MAETIAAIKKKFEMAEDAQRMQLEAEYASDERQGVQKIVEKYRRQREKYEQEVARTEKMKEFEYKYAEYAHICGIDEVGRGPLAGDRKSVV